MTEAEARGDLVLEADAAADLVLERWWNELRADPRVAPLLGIAPAGRGLGAGDLITMLPMLMLHLQGSEAQLVALDAVARAYARAAGLHFLED